LGDIKGRQNSDYPETIKCLPEAEIHIKGAKAWILQAASSQLVFFQFEPKIDLPAHSHVYVQWGMVIDGEMELTISGKPRICRKGDEYVIPAGASHSARFLQKTRVMDFFPEKNRYQPSRQSH